MYKYMVRVLRARKRHSHILVEICGIKLRVCMTRFQLSHWVMLSCGAPVNRQVGSSPLACDVVSHRINFAITPRSGENVYIHQRSKIFWSKSIRVCIYTCV